MSQKQTPLSSDEVITFSQDVVTYSGLLQHLCSLQQQHEHDEEELEENSNEKHDIKLPRKAFDVSDLALQGFLLVANLNVKVTDAEKASLNGTVISHEMLMETLEASDYIQAHRKWYNNLNIALRLHCVDVGKLDAELSTHSIRLQLPELMNNAKGISDESTISLPRMEHALICFATGAGVDGPLHFDAESFVDALNVQASSYVVDVMESVLEETKDPGAGNAAASILSQAVKNLGMAPPAAIFKHLATPAQFESLASLTLRKNDKIVMIKSMIGMIKTLDDAPKFTEVIYEHFVKPTTNHRSALGNALLSVHLAARPGTRASSLSFGTRAMLGALIELNRDDALGLIRRVWMTPQPARRAVALALSAMRNGPELWNDPSMNLDPRDFDIHPEYRAVVLDAVSDWPSDHQVWTQASTAVFKLAAELLSKHASLGLTVTEHSKRAKLLRIIDRDQCDTHRSSDYLRYFEALCTSRDNRGSIVKDVWRVMNPVHDDESKASKVRPRDPVERAAQLLATPERDGLTNGELLKRAKLLRMINEVQCKSSEVDYYATKLRRLPNDGEVKNVMFPPRAKKAKKDQTQQQQQVIEINDEDDDASIDSN